MTNIEEVDGRINLDTKVGSEKNNNDHDNPNDPTSTRISDGEGCLARITNHPYTRASWNLMTWTPKRCRWDPGSPPKFSLGLNLLFGFVSFHLLRVFTVYRIPSRVQKLRSAYFQMALSDKSILGGEVDQDLMAP
jgi:hypothetical protein